MKSLEILFLKSASALSHSQSVPTLVRPVRQGWGSIPAPGPDRPPTPPPQGGRQEFGKAVGFSREGEGRSTAGRGWEELKVGKKVWVERILQASTRGCSGTPGRGRWEKLWLIFSEVSPAMSYIYLAFPCANPGPHTKAANSPLDAQESCKQTSQAGGEYSSVRSAGSWSLKHVAPPPTLR